MLDSSVKYNYVKAIKTLVRHNVLVVTVAYRLGFLGYFYTVSLLIVTISSAARFFWVDRRKHAENGEARVGHLLQQIPRAESWIQKSWRPRRLDDEAIWKFCERTARLPLTPVIDGDFLKEPLDVLRAEALPKIVICGV
ncbi:hypothetical protein L596_010998 [Steinernema carpocapsae]|uniref:Uncharacterized protein n=1 Tax=Steinernema carpocapsae TaxID=34508 RepID=A0A4U5NRW8_STECR|nr:hypothetical protein L596_010998 [Steinernema carpocapsae]